MTPPTDDLRARLEALLASDLDRGALLRALDAASREPGFGDCADLWAPALYDRDPAFFETFLLHHLDDTAEPAVRALLARAEADGHEALFAGLYRKIAEEEAWNAELLALAASPQPDDAVLRAVRWRDRPAFTLTDETALALYRRNPDLFREFVSAHVSQEWGSDEEFTGLREEAKRRGDDALYWALFRRLATSDEWQAAVRELLGRATPTGAIVAELRLRQPESTWELEGASALMADVIAQYGAAVMPYVEENIAWIANRSGRPDRRGAARLLEAIHGLGDEGLYWRLFFSAGTVEAWNAALRDALAQPLDAPTLRRALELRTPPPGQRGGWHLQEDLALAIYARDPALAAPFLEAADDEPGAALFSAAERAGDEDFLDFLTARLTLQIARQLFRAFPTPATARWQKPDPQARARVEQLGALLTARFDRLHAQSPAAYARHAAAALTRIETDTWSLPRNATLNPALVYLLTRHHAAWWPAADPVRDLLESLNEHLQLIALTILRSAGPADPDAARRVGENLPLLRAILLGGAARATKKVALACLEHAGRQDPAIADRILPLLADALHLQGKRAIDERIMVAYVRLRHHRAALPAPAAAPSATAPPA